MALRREGAEERICNNWKTLGEVLQEGGKRAYLVSKYELHVWRSDSPQDGDRCECGAVTW